MPSSKAPSPRSSSARRSSSKKVAVLSSPKKTSSRRAAASRVPPVLSWSARLSLWLDTVSPASVLGIGLCVVMISMFHSLFVDMGEWYTSLPKPGIQFSGWIFEVLLMVAFVFATASAVTIWNIRTGGRMLPMCLLVFSGLLHVAWSMLFFGFHAVQLALVDIVILWIVLWTIILLSWSRSRAAALLLLPYLGWVTFVTVFNGLIALHYLA